MDTSRSTYQKHRRWIERTPPLTRQRWALEHILGQHALAHIDGFDPQRVARFNAEWADAIVRGVGGGAGDVEMRFLQTVRAMVEQFNNGPATMDTIAAFYATISGSGACDRRVLEEARRHLQTYAYELSYWNDRRGRLVAMTEADYDHAVATMVAATTLGVWMDAVL
jgi:hypothetical protein